MFQVLVIGNSNASDIHEVQVQQKITQGLSRKWKHEIFKIAV